MGLIYGGGPYNEKIRPGPYIRSKSRFFETGVGLISDIRPGPYNRGNTVRDCNRYQHFLRENENKAKVQLLALKAHKS